MHSFSGDARDVCDAHPRRRRDEQLVAAAETGRRDGASPRARRGARECVKNCMLQSIDSRQDVVVMRRCAMPLLHLWPRAKTATCAPPGRLVRRKMASQAVHLDAHHDISVHTMHPVTSTADDVPRTRLAPVIRRIGSRVWPWRARARANAGTTAASRPNSAKRRYACPDDQTGGVTIRASLESEPAKNKISAGAGSRRAPRRLTFLAPRSRPDR